MFTLLNQTHSHRQNQLGELQNELAEAYVALQHSYTAKCWELVEYKQQAHYWEAEFRHSKNKQAELESELEELKAQLRQREQQLFGKKSEHLSKQDKTPSSSLSSQTSAKPRGQ